MNITRKVTRERGLVILPFEETQPVTDRRVRIPPTNAQMNEHEARGRQPKVKHF